MKIFWTSLLHDPRRPVTRLYGVKDTHKGLEDAFVGVQWHRKNSGRSYWIIWSERHAGVWIRSQRNWTHAV